MDRSMGRLARQRETYHIEGRHQCPTCEFFYPFIDTQIALYDLSGWIAEILYKD